MSTPRASYPLLAVMLAIVFTGAGDAKADALRGQILSEQRCSQCHGVRPKESSPNAKAPSFSAIALEPSATEYALHVFLRIPHPTMPNFVLQPDDIDDIVSYVVSLKPKK